MANQDILQRFLFEEAPIRGEFVQLHHSFQTIMDQHQYPAPIRQILGHALAASVLLSAIIKFKGRLTVQFRGSGKLKLLLAQCDNQLRIRGLAKWEGELSYPELIEAFQEGVLAIMLDAGGHNRYQGIVNWQGNSLAESIEGYFRDSEQLATKIVLAVNETDAYGLLLQVVPGSDKQTTGLQEATALPAWQHVISVAPSVDNLFDEDTQSLLTTYYPNDTIRVYPSNPVAFHCSCSQQRSETALLLMGRDEAEAELKTNRTIVVTCDFCNKQYIFDRDQMQKVFADHQHPPQDPDIYLH